MNSSNQKMNLLQSFFEDFIKIKDFKENCHDVIQENSNKAYFEYRQSNTRKFLDNINKISENAEPANRDSFNSPSVNVLEDHETKASLIHVKTFEKTEQVRNTNQPVNKNLQKLTELKNIDFSLEASSTEQPYHIPEFNPEVSFSNHPNPVKYINKFNGHIISTSYAVKAGDIRVFPDGQIK